MSDFPVLIRHNGPLFITAEDAARLQLTDHTGARIALPEGRGITLCRCGASKRKPFCDKSHKEIGWDGTLDPTGEAGGAKPATETPGTGA